MSAHPDFEDFVQVLNERRVDYVMVGAYALAFHGHPRATGDLDVWVRPEPGNIRGVLSALRDFGVDQSDLGEGDFRRGNIIQVGRPPVRIDLLTRIRGLDDEEVWGTREPGIFGRQQVYFLGRQAFIKNKRAKGRHKDLADLELLGEKP